METKGKTTESLRGCIFTLLASIDESGYIYGSGSWIYVETLAAFCADDWTDPGCGQLF